MRGARTILFCAAIAAVGCQTPAAAPVGKPFGGAPRFAAVVPDELDRAAADLARAVLLADARAAIDARRALEAAEAARDAETPSGLVAAGHEAANAVLFPGRAGRPASEALLERDDFDAASRTRVERWLADDSLVLARRRVRDARYGAFARFFNAVSEPVGRSALATTLLPYRLGHALASYAIDFAREDPLPLPRRQALAHWKDFRRRYPESPEGLDLDEDIADYQLAWHETRERQALARAEKARDDGRLRSALLYARRAQRHRADDEPLELVAELEQEIEAERQAQARSLGFEPEAGTPVQPDERRALVAALGGGAGDVASPAPAGERLLGARRFLAATALGRAGDDAGMWRQLEELAEEPDDPVGRHAVAELRDPRRNAYGAFRYSRRAERWRMAAWVVFGPLVARPERGALGAADYLLDLPLRAQAIGLLPIRLLMFPWREATSGEREIAVHARNYLERSPQGGHAEELANWLIDFETRRENWLGVLRVASLRGLPDADLDVLRERAATQALAVGRAEERRDLRTAMLTGVARRFPETRAGAEAGRLAREQAIEGTPHRVRLSRGFLSENPEVAGATGLDLAPELLDEDLRNGELHPEGVVWVGGREVVLHFVAAGGDEDDPPEKARHRVPAERLARLVARLEETSFRNSLLDRDDALESDPQRDALFERARLGLVDDVDERAGAETRYAYRGIRERYGMVRSRESFLPVELVVQGSLRDLAIGAFPRLVLPEATPDALLYR